MPVSARYYTDPACPVSWGREPALRRLMVEFGPDLQITYVMGGLARDFPDDAGRLVMSWLGEADRSGMPVDPRLWTEGRIQSSYPACMAVKAAAEQGGEAGSRYLRVVREGLMCFRRKLDTTEALVEEARRGGLDAARFRIDLESHATVEAFGADLEETRALPEGQQTLPTLALGGDGGEHRLVAGSEPYDAWRDAVLACGGEPGGGDRPGVLDAVRRFGRMAVPEIEALCDLPGPRAHAELWALASEWRLKPVRVLTGWLFEAA
jgi:putative protein-disulfide isomerase